LTCLCLISTTCWSVVAFAPDFFIIVTAGARRPFNLLNRESSEFKKFTQIMAAAADDVPLPRSFKLLDEYDCAIGKAGRKLLSISHEIPNSHFSVITPVLQFRFSLEG
jgi:hypothetical protein